jgi:prohibitin 1
VVAQYNAEELLSKRAKVSAQIGAALVERAARFNLILDDVSITHLTFGKEFARAIENKQVAQQEAETQAYLVAKADQERKAVVIRAEGEAEAAELISKAMQAAGNGLIEVRRIDAAKDVAATLAKARNVTYLPSGSKGGSNLLLGINTQN